MSNIFPVAGVSAAFFASGFSGKLIVVVLFIGSIYAWTVMLSKYVQLKSARRMNEHFLAAYRKEPSQHRHPK